MFVVVGLINADDVWSCCWDAMAATASTSLSIGLPESEFCFCGIYSTIDNVFLGEMYVAMICF